LSTVSDDRFVPTGIVSRYKRPRATIDANADHTWLRRARPLVLSHKWTLLTALTMSFIGLLLQVQLPNVLNHAITNSLQKHTAPLSHYVLLAFGFGVAAGLAAYVSRVFLLRTAYALEFDLRNLIYEHLTRLPFSFYDHVQSGQLISRANSDIRSVQMYLTFAPAIIVQCLIAVVAFVYMLSINVPLALVAMSTLPLVFIVGVRMRRVMFPVSWLTSARLAEVATIVDENINGVRVVKSFAAEQRELTMLAKAAKHLEWAYIKDADLRARFSPIVQNLPQLGLVLILLFGGYLAIHGHLQVGGLLAFSAYIVMLQAPFQMLGMLVMMGQRAAASAKRIYEILDEQPEITDSPYAIEMTECRGEVNFDEVDFAYGDGPPVLEGFSLHIAPGETVALVGRTASGKTTISRLLPRFYDVQGGAVEVDGIDVRGITLASLRAQIGVVLDEPFLFSASIHDNIAYGRPDASLEEVRAAARAADAEEFILELSDGYDAVVGERGYTLSGGQRQRIAIARTLLVNPPILILDDATSAVDVQVEQQIHEGLQKLLEGRTTLIVAHRLSTIALADRVVLVDDGRVAAQGTHQELLETTPLYAEVLAQAEEQERHMQEPAEVRR
jgi:ATP-binding cassette, subfamily B, bacterial